MAQVEIWHNPRCSKSRATLELLQARLGDDDLRIVRYLETPPTRAQLVQVLSELGLTPGAFVRRGEALFAELGLDQADDDALLDAMVAHPLLIERPVVLTGSAARIGRPPERVLEIL
ncbi:MAG TPA: arsenate reductase (glutaredoxin) [Pseudomonadales bacterium]|nr:arsenate reductase (glutaredoxin) [Pseudomonadales bacterium]